MPVEISKEHEQRSNNIAKWLRAHPLINISGLCRQIGYDRRNFASVLEGDRCLPVKYISMVERILKSYGYI